MPLQKLLKTEWSGLLLVVILAIMLIGYLKPSFKSSIQAVHDHKMVDPLLNPGTNDISCHVDFQSILHESQFFGLNFHGPIPQGEFLISMGINERAERLNMAPQYNKLMILISLWSV